MVDGDLFDKLARIACILRKSSEPFGGIQVVDNTYLLMFAYFISFIGYRNGRFFPITASDQGLQSSEICL